jgi:hypothetical protein
VGESFIRVSLKGYRLIFKIGVNVFFGFDEEGNLIDIWIRKDVDSL